MEVRSDSDCASGQTRSVCFGGIFLGVWNLLLTRSISGWRSAFPDRAEAIDVENKSGELLDDLLLLRELLIEIPRIIKVSRGAGLT